MQPISLENSRATAMAVGSRQSSGLFGNGSLIESGNDPCVKPDVDSIVACGSIILTVCDEQSCTIGQVREGAHPTLP